MTLVLALIAAVAASVALVVAAGRLAPALRITGADFRLPRGWGSVRRSLIALRGLNDARIAPAGTDRVVLLGVLALGGLVAGLILAGIKLALLTAAVAPLMANRVAAWRSSRYARAIEREAVELAFALAASLGAGRSVRAALQSVGSALEGPLAHELRIVQRDLAVGSTTDQALGELQRRTASQAIALIVAAIELQRRTGGDLASLLREFGDAFRTRRLARQSARAATAQARFTALVVCGLPLGAGLTAELARPGTIGMTLSQPIGLVMVLLGLAGEAVGCWLIWQVARVRS